MAQDIATLLTRNLHEVFGADDPGRRRAVIDEIFTEDAVFHEPDGIHRGRDAIDRVAGAIRAAQPGLQYSVLRPPEEMHGVAGRIQWVAGHPGEAPAHAGTDFILVRDGRIAAIHLFFDPVPA
ncbi:nuclear transport factor 2 family protein [Roseomonas mucosa]|uniref:nuclear transport factor 2 family protein n=1 Tax=Roseomonas mucosa TaxID=207340 RepID=UPI0028CF1400|nr:nuclear transport factor 2 family protein [Roseomonas mucosa]MDT8351018.1 nuclear transport factor 2 family protein [Roseomonas mucosa]